MNFNKKIAKKIYIDLKYAKNQNLSITTLAQNICKNLAAVDSTFPDNVKYMIEEILNKISEHQEEQYAATLNTSMEGIKDGIFIIGNLFDSEIACLREYIWNEKNNRQ